MFLKREEILWKGKAITREILTLIFLLVHDHNITSIHSSEHTWLFDRRLIRNLLVSYFTNIFTNVQPNFSSNL